MVFEVNKSAEQNSNEETFPIRQVIRQLMTYAHISEADLCRGVNLPQTTINRLLSGQTNDPRISTLAAIARFFEVSLEQLLGRDLLILNLSFKQGKGSILPLISWSQLPQWLKTSSYQEIPISSWIRTEKLLNEGSFALPAPSALYSLFGKDSILILNRLIQISENDNQIVLVEQAQKNFYLRQVLCEGSSLFLKCLFPPYEMTLMEENAKIHACVVESRCDKFSL